MKREPFSYAAAQREYHGDVSIKRFVALSEMADY